MITKNEINTLLEDIFNQNNLKEVDLINIEVMDRDDWEFQFEEDENDIWDSIENCYDDGVKRKAIVIVSFSGYSDYAIVHEHMNISDAKQEIVNWLTDVVHLLPV